MANNIKGLTVEIGGDTTKLGKALEDVNKRSRSLSSELGEINKLLKFDPGNADLLAQKQQVLAEAVASTAKKLDTLKDAERQVQEQFKRGEVSEEQVRALQREIVATSKKLDDYERAAKETADEIDKLGSESNQAEGDIAEMGDEARKTGQELDTAGDRASNFGEKAKKAGSVALAGFKVVGSAAAAAVGAMAAASVSAAKYADDILTQSTVTGISADKLQAYAYAAELVDVSVDSLAKSMAKNIKSMSSAAEGSKAYAAAYESLGVAVKNADGSLRDSETVYWEAIDALGRMTNETERDATAMQLFGKSAQELNPLIEAGAGRLKELTDEAREAGAVLSGDSLAALGAFDDSLQRLKGSASAAKNALGTILLPELQALTDGGRELISDFTRTLSESDGGMGGLFDTIEALAPQIGDKIGDLIDGLITEITNVLPALVAVISSAATALVPVILQQIPTVAAALIDTVGQILSELARYLPTALVDIVDTAVDLLVLLLADGLPTIIRGALQLFTGLTQGLLQAIPRLIEALPQITDAICTTLLEAIPLLIEAALQLFNAIIQAIPQILDQLGQALPRIIETITQAVTAGVPKLINGAITLFKAILSAIPVIVSALVANLPKIADTIIQAVITAAPLLLEAAIELFNTLIEAMPTIISLLVVEVPNIVTAITGVLLRNIPLLISTAVQLFMGIVTAIPRFLPNLVSQIPSITKAILNGLSNGLRNIGQIGRDLIRGLWNGISSMTDWIISKLRGFGDSVLDGIKRFFGIASPSKVFRDEVGQMLGLGMAEGIERSASAPLKAMAELSAGVLDEAESINGLTIDRQIKNTFTPPPEANPTEGLTGRLDKILAALERGQIIALDGDALIGGTIDRIDLALGRRRELVLRGAF